MLATLLLVAMFPQQDPGGVLVWRELPSLPAPAPAGPFAGVAGGRLQVSGGRRVLTLPALGADSGWVVTDFLPALPVRGASCPHPRGGWIRVGGEDDGAGSTAVVWVRAPLGGPAAELALPPLSLIPI